MRIFQRLSPFTPIKEFLQLQHVLGSSLRVWLCFAVRSCSTSFISQKASSGLCLETRRAVIAGWISKHQPRAESVELRDAKEFYFILLMNSDAAEWINITKLCCIASTLHRSVLVCECVGLSIEIELSTRNWTERFAERCFSFDTTFAIVIKSFFFSSIVKVSRWLSFLPQFLLSRRRIHN